MPVNGASIPLTVGQTIRVPNSPGVGAQKLSGILINNLSPFAVILGYGAHTQWVAPFLAWPIPQSQLGQITVNPQAIAGASTPGVILPTYYFQGEQFPTAPITLPTSPALYGLTTPITAPNPIPVWPAPPVDLGTVSVPNGFSAVGQSYSAIGSSNTNPVLSLNGTNLQIQILAPSQVAYVTVILTDVDTLATDTILAYWVGPRTVAGQDDIIEVRLNVTPSQVVQVNVGATVTTGVANAVQVQQGFGPPPPVNTPTQPLYVTQVPAPFTRYVQSALQSLHVNAAPVASGTAVLIAAGGAQITIVIYGYDLSLTPTATPAAAGLYGVVYEDTTGAVVVADAELRVSTGVGSVARAQSLNIPAGLALPAGAGLKYVAGAGNVAACDIKGVILYTQQ